MASCDEQLVLLSPGKAFYRRGSLGRGEGIKGFANCSRTQTFTIAPVSHSLSSLMTERWLSAPARSNCPTLMLQRQRAAPSTLTRGNGNAGTSSSAGNHIGSGSSCRARSLRSGPPTVAPTGLWHHPGSSKAPETILSPEEEGSGQAAPGTHALDVALPPRQVRDRLSQQKSTSSENPQLSPSPVPPGRLRVPGWREGMPA